jgi:hypothetical protein
MLFTQLLFLNWCIGCSILEHFELMGVLQVVVDGTKSCFLVIV